MVPIEGALGSLGNWASKEAIGKHISVKASSRALRFSESPRGVVHLLDGDFCSTVQIELECSVCVTCHVVFRCWGSMPQA